MQDNLYQKIKKDQLESRKSKNQELTSLLSVLLATADTKLIFRQSEQDQHALMLGICLSYEKSLIKSIDQFKDNPISNSYKNELNLLQQYLPQKLTLEKISDIIIAQKFNNLGEVMKFFKQNYNGLYDPKVVKEIFEG